MDRRPGTSSTPGSAGTPGSPATSRRALLRGGLALGAVAAAGLVGSKHADAATVDYPSAVWSPASTSNYTASNRITSYPVNLVVIHVTQETYADTIRVFQDPAHAASAHYVVKSSDGSIGQCVREHDIAWHAGNWDYNTRSIGIEHEGWVDQPAYFTAAMYHSSAALTAAICDKYGIPKDRNHIIGHVQVPGTDHTDPGPNWDWVRYIRLVNGV
ncbi:N-acetylmuramoyl-L-alanine amidase [Streptomyces sp. So13.3]|uniref:N-acetylmuramoyl-L-alanine amidase n=1 Tax=Streptomyces TaxID=1883 RepID=UPI0011072936|nr:MULTISPECIES: peptidoglycan recognition family protein [Streptomyces]MCZ4096022.1 peptidoglycan recognition family protein [Streptomyces sp. H39-C1]NEA73231.1 N-acetylmuramoyl-L-alanine amidase [Streptomyces sp. SID13588]QNA74071.1 N-acetylmuramoyl-L-alanine amidase [Streptomyces sp. So13.3]